MRKGRFNKQMVIAIHQQHPRWSMRDIADELGCMVEYVSACKRRYNLKIPLCRYRETDPNNILALGREARRAGFTTDMLRKMADAKQERRA